LSHNALFLYIIMVEGCVLLSLSLSFGACGQDVDNENIRVRGADRDIILPLRPTEHRSKNSH